MLYLKILFQSNRSLEDESPKEESDAMVSKSRREAAHKVELLFLL